MANDMALYYSARMDAARFEWDEGKNSANLAKHQVSFFKAQLAFADPHRVIARDLSHSKTEERFYCFGKLASGMNTVRVTYRDGSFKSSAPAIGVKERPCTRKKTTYTNEPLGKF